MTFQKRVLMIAVVLFILIMSVIGVLMTKSKAAMQFPPEIGNCPDYWKLEDVDGETMCSNVKEIGICNESNINFNTQYKSRKQKCNWAKKCNVAWDGITNQGLC